MRGTFSKKGIEKIHAWTPLKESAFCRLWSVVLISNICLWMSEFSVTWTMTQLTESVRLIAMVQTAASLPVFLFSMPFGAAADMLNKHKLLMLSQVWVGITALLFLICYSTNYLNPYLLLALTFSNGLALAIRFPVFSALIAENLPHKLVPSGMALSAVAMNMSRILGPLAAGLLISVLGTVWVFAINVGLAMLSSYVLLTRRAQESCTPKTSKFSFVHWLHEIKTGLRFIYENKEVLSLLTKSGLFFFMTAALLSMLPLQANRFQGIFEKATTAYSLMFASMGFGAILGALVLPRIREKIAYCSLVSIGFALNGLTILGVGNVTHFTLCFALMVFFGFTTIINANSLGVQIQLSLPDWIRARGMSAYQLTTMGCTAAGALFWGNLTALTSMFTTLASAAGLGLLIAFLVRFEGRRVK